MGLASPVHQQQIGGLAAPQQGQGGRGAGVAEGALAFYQYPAAGITPGSSGQHRLLHGPSGVIHPHRIQGHPCSTDQNAGLARAHKAGIQPAPERRGLQLQAGAHLAHGHVAAHRQQAPAGQGCGAAGGHNQIQRFPAQIPNPGPALHQGRQGGVITQAGMEATGHREASPQGRRHIGVHGRGQTTAGGGQPHHGHLGPMGQGLRHRSHDRHRPVDPRNRPQVLAGVLGIHHRHDRPLPVAQHRQARLAGEVGGAAVQQQHHRCLGIELGHGSNPCGPMPNPAPVGGCSRSPWHSKPTNGSSTRLRWLSRSGQRTRGNRWAAAPFSKLPSE